MTVGCVSVVDMPSDRDDNDSLVVIGDEINVLVAPLLVALSLVGGKGLSFSDTLVLAVPPSPLMESDAGDCSVDGSAPPSLLGILLFDRRKRYDREISTINRPIRKPPLYRFVALGAIFKQDRCRLTFVGVTYCRHWDALRS